MEDARMKNIRHQRRQKELKVHVSAHQIRVLGLVVCEEVPGRNMKISEKGHCPYRDKAYGNDVSHRKGSFVATQIAQQ